MKKYYSLLFFFLISISFAQNISTNDTINYLSNGIVEDRNGKIITDSHLKEKFLKDRAAKVFLEKKGMKKAALTPVEMCTNGGFEQIENVGGKNYLKNFLYAIGDPPGPTQCKSISNKADSYINQYSPSATSEMATTVPANLIDTYMGDIKAFDQYALKINYPNSSTYGSIVQGKRFKTNNENFLKFNYKAILQSVYDSSHQDNQAFFKARILNKSNVVVSEFCLVGDEKNCIFTKVPDGSSGYVTLYTANWQSGLLDISGIPNNEEFTVEFMASRCGLGGHFGYAYVDDICLLHSNESFIGSITLDPLNAVCPTLPINVSGVYTLPNSGGVSASVKNITLKLFNETGTVVHTTTSAVIDNANKKFNFVLTNSDIPNATQGNYNVGVYIDYDLQNSSCGGGNFFANASDTDANDGWDISFLNCSSSCNIPVTTAKLSKCDVGSDGLENFNLTDLNDKVVTSTSGLTFTYFKNYNDAFNNSNAISTNYSSGTGTIYVRVNKDPSCYKIIPVSLEVRNPTANITGVLNVCSGSTELTASAGSTYLWSHNSLTTQKITVTDVGVYTVTVTDSYGCSSTASVSIEPSVTAVSPTLLVTQPSCFVSYGTIKVTSPASEYSFDDGATWTTNGTKTNLYPGKYFVKIKTLKGCTSYSQEVDIFQSLLPYPNANATQPRFCGDTGTITVTTNAAYYSFDNGMTWVTNSVADKLQPGTYTIRTKDNAGCISNAQVVLIQSQTLGNADYTLVSPACLVPGTITINTPADFYTFDGGATWGTSNVKSNVTSGNFSVGVKNYLGCISYFSTIYVYKFESQSPQYEVNQPECGTDGTIYIKTEAAQYSFDNGLTWTTSNVAELPPGNYQIRIKNSANCISQAQGVTLNPPTLPYPIYTAENPGCGVNGKITINSVYDFYSFDNGATWVTTNSKILPAGSYYIMVKNNIGCKSYAQSVYLNQQKLPKPSIKVTQPTCSVKGSITINTVADFYSINGGSTWTTNPVFNNLTGYSYDAVVKNSLGCVSDAAYVYFNQAYLEDPTYTAISPSCGNTIGSIKFTSAADQYSINGGSTWSTNPDFPNLPKGYYSLMVRKSGCTSNYISLYFDDTNLATPSVSYVQPTCATKGSITVNAVADFYSIDGGNTWVTTPVFTNLNPAYYYVSIKTGTCKSSSASVNLKQFFLDDPDYTYTLPSCGVGGTITITTPSSFYSIDGGNTWSANPVFSNLAVGSYRMAIKNNLNCTSNLYNNSLNFNRFYLPKPDVEIIQPKCGQNGSIKIVTPASQYSFDGGNTWSTNPVLTNLTSGYYYVMIKNAQNCTSDPYGVSVSMTAYYLPTPMVNVVQPTCSNNGSITVVSNAAFYSFDNGTTWITSSSLLNPAPGYYNIKIKNTAGCISRAASVSVQKYFLSSPQVTTIQPTCAAPSGTIIVNTIADLYSFDNGTTWVTTPIKNNVASGNYNILIKNSFGCVSQSAYAYINSSPTIPAAPAVTTVQPTACDSTDGSIKINTTAISYSFNDGASWTTNPVKNNLGSGTYIIKLKINTYSCESLTTVVNLDSGVAIAAPDVSVTAPTCSVSTGSITVTSPASTYSFDNGLTFTYSNTKSGLLPGTYHVKVKNAAGCISNVANAVISKPAPLPAPVYTVHHPDCNNALGEIKITTTAAEFSFDNGLTYGSSDTKSNLSPGTYNLMIKDAAGCTSLAAMVTINTKPITPDLPQVSITQPLGCTASNGNISVISPAAFYSFDDGVTWGASSNATLAPGTYLVKQKLSNTGCPSPALSVTIDTPPNAPVVPVYNVNQPASCTNPFGDITISTAAAFYSFDNGMTYSQSSNSGQLSPGNYQLKTKNSAGCESVAVLVVIKKPIDTPVMPTVQVQQLDCHNPSGEILINTSGVQYSIDDGVTWTSSNAFKSLAPNTYNVRYKNAIGCISDPTSVIINTYTNNTPTPLASAQQSFCVQNKATIGNIGITGTGIKWYDAPNGGNLLSNSTALTDGKTYYASQIVATCESNRIPVTVKITATLPPTGNSPQLFCISQNAKLTDIKITGSNIKWYSDNVSTVPLPATTALQDGFTYYATQTVDGCESVLRLPILINITSNIIPGLLGPEIKNINIENTTATVIINGSSVYEYSLDNDKNWQDSNVFQNIPHGIHKVYVREKTNICAVTIQEFTIFKINNIITPNGDNVNDGWEIEGLENYPGTVVRVMDKNGRVVLENTVKGKFFWNGTFLGRALPTDNYWYHIVLTDGRLLTGFVVIKNRN